jgi:hypothetical protein
MSRSYTFSPPSAFVACGGIALDVLLAEIKEFGYSGCNTNAQDHNSKVPIR